MIIRRVLYARWSLVLAFGALAAPRVSAEIASTHTLSCARVAPEEAAQVSVGWIARESGPLRTYRLSVEDAAAGSKDACVLEIPSQSGSPTSAHPSVYSVKVMAAPRARLRLRLAAVLEGTSPVVLTEREFVVSASSLRPHLPRSAGERTDGCVFAARTPAPAVSLGRQVDGPPAEARLGHGREAAAPDVIDLLAHNGPRGPPAPTPL